MQTKLDIFYKETDKQFFQDTIPLVIELVHRVFRSWDVRHGIVFAQNRLIRVLGLADYQGMVVSSSPYLCASMISLSDGYAHAAQYE